jgi:toxin HigB-1
VLGFCRLGGYPGFCLLVTVTDRGFPSRVARTWHGGPETLGEDIQRAAQKKLRQLNAADNINDLRIPPGNRLEKLVGNRAGQHSIRINDQYRICFVWTRQGPADVEIADYH